MVMGTLVSGHTPSLKGLLKLLDFFYTTNYALNWNEYASTDKVSINRLLSIIMGIDSGS